MRKVRGIYFQTSAGRLVSKSTADRVEKAQRFVCKKIAGERKPLSVQGHGPHPGAEEPAGRNLWHLWLLVGFELDPVTAGLSGPPEARMQSTCIRHGPGALVFNFHRYGQIARTQTVRHIEGELEGVGFASRVVRFKPKTDL